MNSAPGYEVILARSIMVALNLGGSPTFMQRNGSEKVLIKNIKRFAQIGKLRKTLKSIEMKNNVGPNENLTALTSLGQRGNTNGRNPRPYFDWESNPAL